MRSGEPVSLPTFRWLYHKRMMTSKGLRTRVELTEKGRRWLRSCDAALPEAPGADLRQRPKNRVCRRCGQEKPIGEFNVSYSAHGGVNLTCRICEVPWRQY